MSLGYKIVYSINSAPFVKAGENWKAAAHRLAAERDAALVNARSNVALVPAARIALAHLQELREAWMRGVIDERDNLGGRRSNRNVEVEVALRNALDAETVHAQGKNS